MNAATLYRRVWRWHFMAGLMVAPFGIILAVTGGLYLFKAQYEGFQEAAINAQSTAGHSPAAVTRPADDLLTSAMAAHKGARFKTMTMPKAVDDPTIEIELIVNDQSRLLFVDRFSGTVLADLDKQSRLMDVMKRIHGTLLTGNAGSYVVELMASWMIVLIITGIYLWWPRGNGWRHVFLPFLTKTSATTPSRQGWKRLHGGVGAWVGLMVLFLLLSGLPWTQAWGGGFKWVRSLVGQEGPGQEFVVSLQSSKPKSDGLSLWEIKPGDEGTVTLTSQSHANGAKAISLQQVVSIIAAESMPAPVEISPPKGDNGVWTVRSMIQDRPKRETLHLDKWTGAEVMRIGFDDHPVLERLMSYGVAIHEGALFGWVNQLLGVIAALGVVCLSVAGLGMWWSRRPRGSFAAPPLPDDRRLSTGIGVVILALALFLPLFALSLAAVLLIDTFVAATTRRAGNQ